jgi:hypothetical protein
MATVSRILALPSATDYYPVEPTLNSITYNPTEFNGGTPANFFSYSEPSAEWKNKSSALYKYKVEYYDIATSTWIVSADSLLPTSVGVQGFKGVQHRVTLYTRSNGSDKEAMSQVYYPQTKPNQSPPITAYGSTYGISIAWTGIETISPNFSNNWGGAPASNVNQDREYQIYILSMPSGTTIASPVVSSTQTSYDFGGFFNGTYRVIVYAKNKAGLSTFIPESGVTFTVAPPPPPPPPPPPYFGPGFY